jgi:CIC family chloride channel protein
LFTLEELLLVFIVAVGFSAPAAVALGPVLKGAERFFKKIPIIFRAATGALITGGIAISLWLLLDLHPEHILGSSEETINNVGKGTGELVLQTWWILLLAVVAKTLATASTLKSGGSVGMLFPSMYMGGLVGAAAFYLLSEIGLAGGTSVTVFVATGMAAALTSVAGVPIAAIALVIEVFGAEYSPAACFACAVCFTAGRRFSLYVQTASSEHNETTK